MLSVRCSTDRGVPHCDGVSRREFLKIGGLGLGGLSLSQLLRAEALAGRRPSNKSLIMIFLSGGPPHQDLVDLKPDAPVEVRGEFNPIATNVPGIEICELLPQLAQRTDRLAILRSIVGSEGRHAGFQCLTGRTNAQQPQGGWPALGSVVSKLQGPADPAVPPFASLIPKMKGAGWSDPGRPGFLGVGHSPFRTDGDGLSDMSLNGVTIDRLDERRGLLAQFDRFRRDADAAGLMAGLDDFQRQAFGILTSSKLAEALDLEREDRKTRDRYGYGSLEPAGYGDAGPLWNPYFLTARRLIEAGARVVTLAYGRWDWHGKPHGTTFENSRHHMPMLDQGVSALLDDLRERGLDKDTTVIVWGEFGRTPKINANGGRDHWPNVSCAMLAGGGLRTGQVIGATDRLAGEAADRPISFAEVFATLYHQLGIDAAQTTINDLHGRPQYLVDNQARPIAELL
ncbi:MAG: DUF1501 domain-containing protein [Planctomycetaceae bacterium]|nr:DUF1501 domain-containing protein [Planctomycetaceae bacterium]